MNNNELYVSLDIGTSNTKVIVGEMTDDSLNIIGVGNVPSEGLKKGSIVDIDETVHSIRKAFDQAERMVGFPLKKAIVGVNGNYIHIQDTNGVVAVSSENKEIHVEDVRRVMEAAQVVSVPHEQLIVDVIPKQFIVDGRDEITDPKKMLGVRLEVEGTLITGSKTILHNLLRCVERAGVEITDICLQPLAAGSAALSKDEKNLGVAMIDIGGGSTTVAVFEQGHLKETAVIPLGGENITKDVSIGLRTSTEEAERVKKQFGHAFYDEASEDEVFEVTVIGTNQKQSFTQQEIANIIEARVEEILEIAATEIEHMGITDLPGGFVLTGGQAAMPGVLSLAQEVLRHNVRVASPNYIGVRDPQYMTGVGLIQFACRNARIQGRKIGFHMPEEAVQEIAVSYEEEHHQRPEAQQRPKAKQKTQAEHNKPSKMKKLLSMFWE
ncbi:cell division protein FtsA [Bacillus sp. L381]|jgi:cell division protein FtsA|uniref:Cell division protein FtsA n=1 Tax=Bacillus amyloliquefaciens (strain ATCC 23350 / DSM 7 / BCRC 11601 / CCUG 28519 / NBRC 15535 / NRRL B-14393 / F) TaxID=692420 RepID=A0A9P1JGW0_BACAS|nr:MULTISPECIES: cell division protein FtsA [Bacillus]AIW33535.1 cell division protein FtsA [Bacillus subtilis]AEB24072.1 cell division protein FtsA [Bacillus amyloliquefaciens TA208]AEB63223.1 cell-division protein essential fo Z-ring assembly [Bacillus amyloliquefaciens LL3]AEK89070.1 cell-division protein FtsA [Bacillus amyloliquefaciens XH7]AOC90941.1 Cell division protein FtsA [Bacillus amyloliquefaciens]